jgi:hypothetical protein
MDTKCRRYWIAEHAFVAWLPTATIFMNVRTNRYFAIGESESRALSGVIHGWPDKSADAGATGEARCNERQQLICMLLKNGLITENRLNGKACIEAPSIADARTGVGPDTDEHPPIHLRDVLRFAAATACAFIRLTLRSLHYTISLCTREPEREVHGSDSATIGHVVRTVSKFRRIRAWSFGARNNCLLHALSLRTYLAYHGISASWVFGVRMHPWAAHTWLQYGALVLDGSPEEVRFYTPILVIPS